MASTDYLQLYGQAEKAYLQGNFSEAANIIDRMVEDFPDDPSVLLLRGHIYCYGLQNYNLAKEQYDSVLELTEEEELISFAHKGLEKIRQIEISKPHSFTPEANPESSSSTESNHIESQNYNGNSEAQVEEGQDFSDWEQDFDLGNLDWEGENDPVDDGEEDPTLQQNSAFSNPFTNSKSPTQSSQTQEKPKYNPDDDDDIPAYADDFNQEEWQEQPDPTFLEFQKSSSPQSSNNSSEGEDSTFVVSSELEEMLSTPLESRIDENFMNHDFEQYSSELSPVDNYFQRNADNNSYRQKSSIDEDNDTDNFALFEQEALDNISNFDIPDIDQDLPASSLFSSASRDLNTNLEMVSDSNTGSSTGSLNNQGVFPNSESGQTGLNLAAASTDPFWVKPTVEIDQGMWAWLENAPLRNKHLTTAVATGVVSFVAVGVFTFTSGATNSEKNKNDLFAPLSKTALISLVAGVASFGTTFLLGQITTKHIRRYIADFQQQLESIYQGNFETKTPVYSEDEFGQLAAGFNQMGRVILSTTSEAQRRAEETERAREDLQRQVIRLLDDVEGAARGDLTVQAEVTADVLGAVADAFNLTIQNLREIVKQVKLAAEEVNQGSTDSELFARNQSSDALRMAEELAVTLNSVQMMTDSIQRVAENAREAEEVARSSSVTALKGGKAVERTVAGILQIRETVSETTRKVKRLAEASQEISKIVALISQISTRTNLLALNASIQSARAGEAGKGFAIVADEVRQLADRSAKALQEIEQIVLQIQTETGAVMTAMEEGIQQVIDVVKRAEQAKGSLEDIIQVSNHIDALVRSITADTVEQRENSRAVAQVMQSVELTAQETSQESQRVAGSLQNLVGIARDLLVSVERFRVDLE